MNVPATVPKHPRLNRSIARAAELGTPLATDYTRSYKSDTKSGSSLRPTTGSMARKAGLQTSQYETLYSELPLC